MARVTATLDGETIRANLTRAHRLDGATFNRFGLLNVMKGADTGNSLWLDDLTLNGAREPLDRDPQWDESGNRRTYRSQIARPLLRLRL